MVLFLYKQNHTFYVNFKETLINKTPVKPVRKKNISLDRNMF